MLVKLIPVVNFTNILFQLLRRYFCAKKVQTLNPSTKKASRETFVQKSRAYYVGEIDTCASIIPKRFFVALTMRSKWTTN